MIPTQLLIVIAAQRETVPFPAVIEALTMEVAFEILREAGQKPGSQSWQSPSGQRR
jgi:spore germination protein KA